jgi:hypothetical protein
VSTLALVCTIVGGVAGAFALIGSFTHRAGSLVDPLAGVISACGVSASKEYVIGVDLTGKYTNLLDWMGDSPTIKLEDAKQFLRDTCLSD